MPRYKCKVDTVLTYEFEVNASSEDTAEVIASNTDVTKLQEVEFNTEVVSIEKLPEIAALFTYPALPSDAPQDLKDAYTVFEKYLKASIELPGTTENDNLLAEHINANKEYSNDPTSLTGDFMNHQSKEKIRKQSDTTKISQKQYDEIMFTYNKYKDGLLLGVNSSTKLVNYLNGLLGLNKSRSVYSKIWCGGVTRESLPKGE